MIIMKICDKGENNLIGFCWQFLGFEYNLP
jgi:hypothetical protein